VYCYDTACSLLDENFGKTFFSDAHHKMLGIIRSAGKIYKGQLRASHAMRRLDKRVFEEALDALEEMGMVELVTKQPDISGGRPTVSIRLTRKRRKADETI
jgi:DNA-binding MarR family transcriptional regulator